MAVENVSVFPTIVGCVTLSVCVACQSEPTPTDRPPAETKVAPAPRGERPQDRDQVDADGIVRRGEALSNGRALTVAAVLEKARALDGQMVKVQGQVGRVCGKSGCWFELRDGPGATGIRITSKGYRFFVPSQASGMKATLEGDLKVRMLDVTTAQHYANDAAEGTGQPAAQVTKPVPEVSIAAVGLEMKKTRRGG